jgi:hypothetical protein
LTNKNLFEFLINVVALDKIKLNKRHSVPLFEIVPITLMLIWQKRISLDLNLLYFLKKRFHSFFNLVYVLLTIPILFSIKPLILDI